MPVNSKLQKQRGVPHVASSNVVHRMSPAATYRPRGAHRLEPEDGLICQLGADTLGAEAACEVGRRPEGAAPLGEDPVARVPLVTHCPIRLHSMRSFSTNWITCTSQLSLRQVGICSRATGAAEWEQRKWAQREWQHTVPESELHLQVSNDSSNNISWEILLEQLVTQLCSSVEPQRGEPQGAIARTPRLPLFSIIPVPLPLPQLL